MIQVKRAIFLLLIIAAAVSFIGCETAEQKSAKTAPPAAAMAPAIQQPSAVTPIPAPSQPLQQQSQTAQLDPVPALIQKAEAAYQAGQTDYAAGHLETAKADFDRAVDILMQGSVDIKSDDRLQREFDKIVEGVHTLEMAALKVGDGFSEQKAEPAPIDEANEVTFPVDPAQKARAEQELQKTASDLPLVLNDYVAGYINFFSTRGHKSLVNSWQRSGRYQEMIRRILKEEGVPQDLMYLAQAESGFHPLAVSRVGARGMWQFMHYTAPGYGLKNSWWVDDRQDPEKATRAAAKYLKDLFNQFGDWYLAMAAYNSGAGNVQRAVQRTGYADFWELYKRNVLPLETKNYVPIIVAMTIIAKNPAQYGLTPDEVDPPQAADKVMVDYAVDLRLVAEAVDAPLDQLADLNPSLLRLVTPKDAEYELKLPAGTKQKFETAIAAIPEDKRVLWRYHRVEQGDSLDSIARKYKATPKAIAEVNNLNADDEVEAGSKLIIPISAQKQALAANAFSKHPTHYKVRKGDTVLSVADDFAVPPERVRKWNHMKGNSLRVGRSIVIYKPLAGGRPEPEMTAKASNHKKTKKAAGKAVAATHTVKAGETLTSIASQYNTTVAALQKYNGQAAEKLHPGDVLVVRR
jgi:membrane-bound lytic murein transglycosylase D